MHPTSNSMARSCRALLLVAWMAFTLSACGGANDTGVPGNSGGNVTPPARPPSDPASAAQLSVDFTVATNALALNWKDVFVAGTTYRVQSRALDGSWATIGTVASAGGTGSTLSFYKTLSTTVTLRVQAEPANAAPSVLKTNTGATEFTVVVGNPVLSFTAPRDGAFLYGSVTINGNTSSERVGPLEVTATLGSAQATTTATAGSFSLPLDLSALAAGTYSLSVRSTDSGGAVTTVRRNVVIASSAALAYTPLFAGGAGTELLAIESDNLLYSVTDPRTGARSVRLRVPSTDNEVILSKADTIDSATAWQLSGGRVYVQGRDTDCPQACIYEWAGDGARRNLSTANPIARSSDQYPVAHDGFVIWTNVGDGTTGSYTLFDVTARSYRRIAPPAAALLVGNTTYDFFVRNGYVTFFFWATVAGSGMASVFDVFRWTSIDGATQRWTNDAVRSVYPASDGTDVIWQQSPVGQIDRFDLVTRPVAGGNNTTIATAVTRWYFADQTVAWTESAGTMPTIQARYRGVPSTLATGKATNLYGTRSGYVLYLDGDRTLAWSGAARTATVRVDVPIRAPIFSINAFYFVQGADGLVYRATFGP